MNTAIQDLERKALDAHRAGIGWPAFWYANAAAIRAASTNPLRPRQLMVRSMRIVAKGDPSREEPGGRCHAEGDRQRPGAHRCHVGIADRSHFVAACIALADAIADILPILPCEKREKSPGLNVTSCGGLLVQMGEVGSLSQVVVP